MNEDMKVFADLIISEMGKRFEAVDRCFEQMDRRFEQIDKRLEQMDQRIDRTEEDMKMYVNMLVEEMGRMQNKIDQRFEKVDQRLDSMQHEINGCKLACDTNNLLMQRLDQHETRIERLEKKSGVGKMLTVGN